MFRRLDRPAVDYRRKGVNTSFSGWKVVCITFGEQLSDGSWAIRCSNLGVALSIVNSRSLDRPGQSVGDAGEWGPGDRVMLAELNA